MFKKVLVANRGEIAIRAFSAAYEPEHRVVVTAPPERVYFFDSEF